MRKCKHKNGRVCLLCGINVRKSDCEGCTDYEVDEANEINLIALQSLSEKELALVCHDMHKMDEFLLRKWLLSETNPEYYEHIRKEARK